MVAIALLGVLAYVIFSTTRRSEQNRVWVGLAKETAHQLGTPMSSLMAWVDLIESDQQMANADSMAEMRKDIDRLKVITERFSKIGSTPVLSACELNEQLQAAIEYIKTRSSGQIHYHFEGTPIPCQVLINPQLFGWVVENICKNAMDAMEGRGTITIKCTSKGENIVIDITDTGKGMPKGFFKRVFKPGFTTKRRGWGLGLSLVKRIVENYHEGHIFVSESIPNKKTTFRIILKQA